MMKKKLRYWILGALIIAVILTPSCVRLYRVFGSSDAPTYLMGDRILVNKVAYDIRIPYTNIVILSHSDPKSGDVVMFREPVTNRRVFKRVIGCPEDLVEMLDNQLLINGTPLLYETVKEKIAQATENNLGSEIVMESGNGRPHKISYTPGASQYGSFGPVNVPEGQYFLIGDNRDNSKDSRMYGPVPRELIIGRVSHPYGRHR